MLGDVDGSIDDVFGRPNTSTASDAQIFEKDLLRTLALTLPSEGESTKLRSNLLLLVEESISWYVVD